MSIPDWVLTTSAWVVMIGGLVLCGALAIFLFWLAVQMVIGVSNNDFRRDIKKAANYLLWRTLRLVRSPEANALDWAPPEVEAWARKRVAKILKVKED